MDKDSALIQLDGIRFAYPGRPELFGGLDFAVREGDRLAVVGANGSGKTSLFHLIVGLQRLSAGRIRAFGRDVERRSDFNEVRRKVGFLFQDSDDQLFSPTVREDVAFGPLNLGKTREEVVRIVDETLAWLDLSGYADRIGYDLSGGEKRLVALATTMAMKPQVLLLDEPAAGLDPQGRSRLIELLAQIGGTHVISSHDMEFVRATCLRVVVMDKGQLIAEGPTDEILGDADLMLQHGLEVPYSLEAGGHGAHDHRHGAGTSHGHGHGATHVTQEHKQPDKRSMS